MLFIGTGVSGGEEGALKGPSIMPGGSPAAWPHVKPIFQAIAAKTEDGTPCCDWVGRERRRPLREDGPQRHRVRRHAAHLRGLRHPEERARDVGLRDARRVRGVEQGRARQLPDRDHPRHPRLQGRGRPAARRQDPRHRRPEGHRQVDGDRGARARHPADPHRRGGLRALPLGDQGGARRGLEGPRRARSRSSRATARPSSTTSARRSTPPRSSPTPRATADARGGQGARLEPQLRRRRPHVARRLHHPLGLPRQDQGGVRREPRPHEPAARPVLPRQGGERARTPGGASSRPRS